MLRIFYELYVLTLIFKTFCDQRIYGNFDEFYSFLQTYIPDQLIFCGKNKRLRFLQGLRLFMKTL